METSRKDILSYAASCNPPRRAKRPSTGGNTPAVEERAGQPLPTLPPAMVALSADVITRADDDDFTTADVPQPKRRGRKPSSLSRAAEKKARRTKINEALSMLRDLVPADAGRKPSVDEDDSADEDDEDDEFGSGSGKKPAANGGKQRQEKSSSSRSSRRQWRTFRSCRKRSAYLSANATNSRRMKITTSTPLGITWRGLLSARTPPINPIQLPTPPASAVIGPITSPQVPPSLRLELPMASLATRNFSTPPKSASSSPSWTPEDESIASLLLRIKSSSSPKASRHGANASDLLAPTPEAPNMGDHARFTGVDEMRVQTPGSLLGLTSGSK
ncbi:hypothetical protein EDB84DRAFT_1471883 [Lactarius hengduanensis]|nr:hypothetical protein EDB84DRAFT_1471883 [Lactarius hengduanensis]